VKIAFDMSSYIWTALLVGKDEEGGYQVPHPSKAEKMVHVNSADYGYENVINMMCAALHTFQCAPIDCLLIFEGMQSKKQRMMIDKEYKAGRDADRPAEAYVEFEKVRERVRKTWKDLGACAVSQPFVEGDDVLAWLARETEEDMVIATRDRDLTVLNQVNDYGATVQVLCGDHKIGENPYGPWDLKLLPLYKALVGDSSDNIKGVVGFGDGKWIDFLSKYGEDGALELLELLEQGALGPLHAQAEECKLIKLICSQEANAIKSYKCGRLYPDWVNTLKHQVEFSPGMVSLEHQADERLQRWAGEAHLITADNFDFMTQAAERPLAASPELILDIETSTPPESDEWLAAQGDPEGVDVLGSKLTGLGLTFGRNNNITYYFSVDHARTQNVSSQQVCGFIANACKLGKPLVIQNVSFELAVLYNEWAAEMEKAFPEYRGFLPRVLDTKFEASYVNENEKTGLKGRSKMHLGYEQQTYDQTTKLSGKMGTLPPGGRQLRVWDIPLDIPEGAPAQPLERHEERRYKVNELSAEHVFGYGIDDTICTAALHNYYRLVMQLEHTWDVYLDVEIDAAYQHAKNFIDGTPVSIETSNQLMRADDAKSEAAWATVRNYLIEQGFEGTVCPELDASAPLELADIQEIFSIGAPRNFRGYQDVDEDGEPCPRKLRKADRAVGNMSLPKVIVHIKEVEDEPTLALLLKPLIEPGFAQADVDRLNKYIADHFNGEPENPVGSPKKLAKLMYEVMGLPIRVRNNPTDAMRKAGIFEGNPKTDVLAIEYAMRDAKNEQQKAVLKAIKIIQMVRTRHSLYYDKYPGFVHWKTGRVHSQHNQCQANTRRASESGPNKQQLPKHMKIEGEPPLYREVVVPHHRNAVVVSLDFESQELVILAEKSHDPNLISIFVPPPGEDKKSQHTITGLGIFQKLKAEYRDTTYQQFAAILEDKTHAWHAEAKAARALGKKLNFTAEYGAMAEKVKQTLLLDSVDEAQDFLDAREAQFPLLTRWKRSVVEFVKRYGYVLTMEGARRHLRDSIMGDDAWEAMKAERQAINMEIQGSAAEQTKKAEGRMWQAGLSFKYDAICYGPIHDEVVWSVAIDDLHEFLPELHACMVAPYGGITVVPIGSSISFGPDFYNQIEIGNQPTREAIEGGLKKYAEMMDERLAA
jgi:5'-3' exonuclease